MVKVLVLGASGMLGQGVLKALRESNLQVMASTRNGAMVGNYEGLQVINFDAFQDSLETFDSFLGDGDFIINCIGVIKPYIKDDNPAQRRNALEINGLFPDRLSNYALAHKLRVIQIATDCVFSGKAGNYDELASFDALDVYGKTKSLGEVPSNSMMHLRVSIIGTESGRSTSLWEWVRNQPKDSTISGFTDHDWNGVTTFHFGKIVRGIIEAGLFRAGTFHIVPSGEVTKYELVAEIARASGRYDIHVEAKPSGNSIDRTLRTIHEDFNDEIWKSAGYQKPPTVIEMIREFPLG